MSIVNLLNILDKKELRYWLPFYLAQRLKPKEALNSDLPIHLMFCVVDHFEPFNDKADFDKAKMRVKVWEEKYPEMADKFLDADNQKPRHSWFYPPHHDLKFLKTLVELCKRGYGEIEMHLHHNHMFPFPDTAETLKSKILKCVEDYSEYGIFCLPGGGRKFAFIHGDWSLANARGKDYCGINNEIDILKDCGCYADFTFPSLGVSQPALINRVYYGLNYSGGPKSYNWGEEVVVNKIVNNRLLLIPGILGLRRDRNKRKLLPVIESSNIDRVDYLDESRVDYLAANAIRIKGRPNWLFIKLHTHGARNADFGQPFALPVDRAHRHLNDTYNDKKKYFLHYVSAREMYNIVKAAEAGLGGNPNDYRNFIIPRYAYLQN